MIGQIKRIDKDMSIRWRWASLTALVAVMTRALVKTSFVFMVPLLQSLCSVIL